MFVSAMEFNIVIEKGEDGYLLAEVLELDGCRTQAKTMDELLDRTREVVELCLEEQTERPVRSFIGFQKIEVNGDAVATVDCC